MQDGEGVSMDKDYRDEIWELMGRMVHQGCFKFIWCESLEINKTGMGDIFQKPSV